MNRSAIYAVLYVATFGLLFYLFREPVAALFLVLAAFHGLQAYSNKHESNDEPPAGPLGVLDHYDVDGDGEKSLGLYVHLLGKPVFVDVKQDSLVDERIRRARFLFANSAALESSLESFIEGCPAYLERTVHSIGLHAHDLEQGEVFWEPDGYTLLRGLNFQQG